MTTYDQHVAKTETYDHNLFLGRVAWFSVFEMKWPHKDFCDLLDANGLGGFKPPYPRGSDVFKRACKESELRKVPTAQSNVHAYYQITEVNKDRDNIWRKVVCETRDAGNRRLDWTVLGEIHYERTANAIHTTPTLEGIDDPCYAGIVHNVIDLYNLWSDNVSSQNVRRLIREVFRATMATAIRPSGGIYFVREEAAGLLDGLGAVLDALPGQTGLHQLPLLDDGKQRLMLRQAFEDESVGEIDRLLGDAKDILSSGQEISADRYAKFTEELQYLRKKANEYSTLLSEKLTQTDTRLDIANATMTTLLSKIKRT
jgi:hypothetical protein